MAQKKNKLATKKSGDDAYLLKLVMYLIIASQWLRITKGIDWQLPLPYGAIIALLFARHEHFKTDRKIEFAVIIVAMFVGFWVPVGLSILV